MLMSVRIINADVRTALKGIPDRTVHCIVTSPPYWGLRDYGVAGQIGLEESLEEYIAELLTIFRETRRVLRDDGTLWLNLGDAYAGSGKGLNGDGSHCAGGKQATNIGSISGNLSKTNVASCKPKDLIGIPWRIAFALRDDGWWLRSEIIWSKPNPMPESVTDRPTAAHEKIFLFTKSQKYFYNADAVRQPPASSWVGRWAQDIDHQNGSDRANGGAKTNGAMKAVGRLGANLRNVWTIATACFKEAHFATFPLEIPERCIKAGCPAGGTVLDPFGGAGTTGLVADRLGRHAILIELNPTYAAMAERRIYNDAPLIAEMQREDSNLLQGIAS